MQTLVIDTSYGSTVGMVGHDPIVETDSRTHVEKLQVNIATTVEQAGLKPENIDRIIVGIGPAPFTGLRAGIVAAKALAFATGAQLIGQNVLSPQVLVRNAEHDGRHHLTLAVNDARRKQLYFTLLDGSGYEAGGSAGEDHDANVENGCVETLIDMDIDYPESIANRVTRCWNGFARPIRTWNMWSTSSAMERRNTRNRGQAFPKAAKCAIRRCSTRARPDWNDSRPSPLRNSLW